MGPISEIEILRAALRKIKHSGGSLEDFPEVLTPAERELLLTLYREGRADEALSLLEELDMEGEWQHYLEASRRAATPVRPLWKRMLPYAAMFVGCVGLGAFLLRHRAGTPTAVVPPNGIILTTSDQGIKVIDSDGEQRIKTASGMAVARQQGDTIRYEDHAGIEELVFDRLEVPYGRIFNLELSDGTFVHLNAGTSIRYPVRFLPGQKRQVYLDGEAYFEVAKDKSRPFIVHADEVQVQVLGTSFNVSSYTNEHTVQTVLVEGSVRMSHGEEGHDPVILSPGKQGVWDKTDRKTTVSEADLALTTGWVKGELVFRDVSFASMARKLERSYDVTIENHNTSLLEGRLLNARFNVNIESIADVMESIRELCPIRYTIKDDKVIIE